MSAQLSQTLLMPRHFRGKSINLTVPQTWPVDAFYETDIAFAKLNHRLRSFRIQFLNQNDGVNGNKDLFSHVKFLQE